MAWTWRRNYGQAIRSAVDSGEGPDQGEAGAGGQAESTATAVSAAPGAALAERQSSRRLSDAAAGRCDHRGLGRAVRGTAARGSRAQPGAGLAHHLGAWLAPAESRDRDPGRQAAPGRDRR